MICISIRVLAIIRLLLEISLSLSFNSTLSVLSRSHLRFILFSFSFHQLDSFFFLSFMSVVHLADLDASCWKSVCDILGWSPRCTCARVLAVQRFWWSHLVCSWERLSLVWVQLAVRGERWRQRRHADASCPLDSRWRAWTSRAWGAWEAWLVSVLLLLLLLLLFNQERDVRRRWDSWCCRWLLLLILVARRVVLRCRVGVTDECDQSDEIDGDDDDASRIVTSFDSSSFLLLLLLLVVVIVVETLEAWNRYT